MANASDNPFPTSTPSPAATIGMDPGMTNGSGGPTANDLVNRMAQSAHQTIDRLAGHAAPHVQHLQDSMGTANAKLHERADQVRHLRDDWTESLRGTVREHPLAAIGTALAVGLLIARLAR